MSKYRVKEENFNQFLNDYNLEYNADDNGIYSKYVGFQNDRVKLFNFRSNPFIEINESKIIEIKHCQIENYYVGTNNLMVYVLHDKFDELFEEIKDIYEVKLANLGFDNIYIKDDFIYATYNGVTCTYNLTDKEKIENGEPLEDGKYLPNELYNLLLEREG